MKTLVSTKFLIRVFLHFFFRERKLSLIHIIRYYFFCSLDLEEGETMTRKRVNKYTLGSS